MRQTYADQQKQIKLTYADGYNNGYKQALKDINTPMSPITKKWENSQCPRCNSYFDEYEEVNDGFVWRAKSLERCPFCGQKLKWR